MIVVGADLSTFAIDLVRLDYDTDQAEWKRIPLGDAKTPKLDRIRRAGIAVPRGTWWDEVGLVGIEQPAGRYGVADIAAVYGAVLAQIPTHIAVFNLRPSEWRKACGLPGNCSKHDVARFAGAKWQPIDAMRNVTQDALDAWAIAYAARAINESAASVAEGNQTQEEAA